MASAQTASPPPNLFSFAPSELSQDAFLTWLMQWSDDKYEATNQALHKAGKALAQQLFVVAGLSKPEQIVKVQIEKQFKHIDIVAKMQTEHGAFAIIIEDKVKTGPHSDQLQRYKTAVEKLKEKEDRKLIFIYLKTGNQSHWSLTNEVVERNWVVFSRWHLLEVLENAKVAFEVKNDIYLDFLEHIRGIETETSCWKTTPFSDWVDKKEACEGFFIDLEKRLTNSNWYYVNNEGGGFMGFWWGERTTPDGKIKLQIENNRDFKLCFKLKVKETDSDKYTRSALRDKWRNHLLHYFREHKIEKPPRMGSGEHMTLCYIREYQRPNSGGIIDLEKTAEYLLQCEAVLSKAIDAMGQGH